MAKKNISIQKIRENIDNPRVIKDYKFKKLVNSLKNFPQMLEKRPIVVDENYMVLGGNMRLKACREAGLEKVWIDIAKDWTDEQKKEFIVKDNLSYGEWDWEILANEYDVMKLDQYGLDLNPAIFAQEEDTESIKGATDDNFNDYTIYFRNEEELEIWYAFLKRLKNKFIEQENISERILRYIAEVYEDNKMYSDSQLVLKFIEYDINGDE
tara:strand:+ start:2562 stop:3194 length:633 start_codon:yes stop_codon:yes gene_type:complete